MKHTITLKQFKLTLITCLVLSLTLVFGTAYVDSPSVRPQFFISGYVEDTTDPGAGLCGYVDGQQRKFNSRYQMITFMNERGYRCVSMAFNTRYGVGQEYYIFE